MATPPSVDQISKDLIGENLQLWKQLLNYFVSLYTYTFSKFFKILPVSLLVIEDFHCPYTSINILVHLVKLSLLIFAIILAIEQKTTLSLHYTILLFSGSQSLLLWNCFAPSYWNSNDTFWWKTMQNVSRSIALTRGFSTNYRNKNGLTLTLILPWILPLDINSSI